MIHLRRLDLRAAPGLPDRLTLADLAPHLNIVLGPNASGKSTLARALRATLWPSAVGGAADLWARSQWQRAAGQPGGPPALLDAELAQGRAVWSPAPPPLPPAHAAPLYLLSLATLLRAQAADGALARQLAVELAGGFDLQAAHDAFPRSARPGRNLRKALDQARSALARAERDTDARTRDEQLLKRQEAQLQTAQEAQEHLALARSLLRLLQARSQAAAAQAALEAFPPGLDRLAGDELERLETARAQRQRWLREAQDNAEARATHEAAQLAAARELPPALAGAQAAASSPLLLELPLQADALTDLQRRLEAARTAAAGAHARAREAARTVVAVGGGGPPGHSAGGDPGDPHEDQEASTATRLSSDALGALTAAAARAAAARVTLDAADEALQAAQGRLVQEGAPQSVDVAGARARVQALRRWLATPAPAPSVPPARPPGWLLWALGLAGVAGAALLVVVLTRPAGTLGGLGLAAGAGVLLGVALGGAAVLRWGGGRPARRPELTAAAPTDDREVWAREALRCGVGADWDPGLGQDLATWEAEAVERALAHGEAALARGEAAARAADEVEVAQRRRQRAARAADEAQAALQAQAERLGVATGFAGLALVAQAQALAAWAQAELEARAAQGALEQLEDAWADKARALAEALGHDAPPRDAAEATARVRAVVERARRWREAGQEAARAGEAEVKAGDEAARAEAEIARLFQVAGVSEIWSDGAPEGAEPSTREAAQEAALRGRLARLPGWREARARADAARSELDGLEARVDAGQACEALALTPPGVEGAGDRATEDAATEDAATEDTATEDAVVARLAALEEQAARVAELSAEVGRLREALRAARAGHTLEDAVAAEAEARAALGRAREAAAADALGRALLEAAGAAQTADNAPPALARARRWFARFTRGAWGLELAPGGEAFLACDAGGQARPLEALSDATRVQLLLAARLGALEAVEEASGPLPLCLDEVLSTTDPGRFEAIAQTILKLSQAGRQVLYFTAEPSEAARWRQVCADQGEPEPAIYRLGDARERPARLPRLGPAETRAVADVPPDGDAARWGEALGVHAPDGHRAAGRWHLLYVGHDALEQVRACLLGGVEDLGAWRRGRSLGLPPAATMDEAAAARWEARARALEGVLEAWAVGRGRPVTWADVEPSGAVSDTFAERARTLLGELAGARGGADARAVLEGVGGLKGFRAAKKDQLRAHLVEVGALDERPLLAPDELVAAGVARARAFSQDPASLQDAAAFGRRLVELLASQAPGPAPRVL